MLLLVPSLPPSRVGNLLKNETFLLFFRERPGRETDNSGERLVWDMREEGIAGVFISCRPELEGEGYCDEMGPERSGYERVVVKSI